MKFFLDNNLPPNWAACLSGCSKSQFDGDHVETVVHLQHMFRARTPDVEWIQTLSVQRSWAIISGDAFRKRAGAERQVLRQSGLSVFVLQPSWSSYPYWDKTAQLVKWWPRIVEQANTVEGVALEVPWKLSGKFRQL